VLGALSPRELFGSGTHSTIAGSIQPVELKTSGIQRARDEPLFQRGAATRDGYTAFEYEGVGYTVRDLITFGYNENHIIGAGLQHQRARARRAERSHVDRQKFRQ